MTATMQPWPNDQPRTCDRCGAEKKAHQIEPPHRIDHNQTGFSERWSEGFVARGDQP